MYCVVRKNFDGGNMNKLLFILLALLIGKIANAQNDPYKTYIELLIVDASQTKCVVNYCPPFSYYKEIIKPEVTLGMWVNANPKVIAQFTYNACLGRSDDSIYKAALYKKYGILNTGSRPFIMEKHLFSFQCRYHRSL